MTESQTYSNPRRLNWARQALSITLIWLRKGVIRVRALVPLHGKTMRQTCSPRASMLPNPVLHERGLSRWRKCSRVDSLNFVTHVNPLCDTDSLLTQASLAPRPPDVPSGFHTVTDTHASHPCTHNFHPAVPWFACERTLQPFHPL